MAGQCFSCSFAPLSLNSYHSLTQQLLYNSIDHTVFEAKKTDDLLPQDRLVVFHHHLWQIATCLMQQVSEEDC
jgi:hypothetical protein